jgi:hypothetical protein
MRIGETFSSEDSGHEVGGRDCIIDVRVTDLDCKSNLSKDPHKVPAHERAKKKSSTSTSTSLLL